MRRKQRKSNNKLGYNIVLVAIITVAILSYILFFKNETEPNVKDTTTPVI